MATKSNEIHASDHYKTVGAAFAVLLLLIPTAALADAIAVADGELPGMRAEIVELKRTSGDTLTLRFTLINESGSGVMLNQGLFGYPDLRYVHLIDAAGMKKYLPVMDSQNNCVCSSGLPFDIKTGERMNLWARFPAPPAEVMEVSVVLPRFIPTDVPIGE